LLTFANAGAGHVPGGVAGVVFGRSPSRRRGRLGVGIGVALAVYAALGTWAATRPARRASVPSRLPEMTVELTAPAPPKPPPPREPARPRPVTRAARLAPVAEAPRPAPAPARAASVVSRAAGPDEPLDLTSFSIATGGAARSVGGDAASGGASDHPVAGAVVGGAGREAAGAADLSRPVSISETEWGDCAWPPEADALGIDEQVVSMRAVAAADGHFESADVVADPGHGFGAALLACARRHGFVPALDRAGNPVRARSGLLRFTFTR
jgi:hypothetical protein